MGDSEPPDDIHIDLGPKSRSSAPPSSREASNKRLKFWVNAVATSVALVAGVVATVKPADKSAARASYDELKKAAEENARNDKQNHDDIVALRNYLDGYFKGMGAPVALPAVSPWASASAVVIAPVAPPLPSLNPEPKPANLPSFDQVVK